jgi:hypothetical protein
MKTTLDLPADILQQLKFLAAQKNETLKDIVARLLRAGLRAEDSRPVLPPIPIKLKGGPLTAEEIRAAIEEGRE